MKKTLPFLLVILVVAFLFSCKKSTETYTSASIADYAPLTVGKYISYKLDSLVFVSFGASSVINSYEVKYAVDAKITDNTGAEAYRIIRYIRKTSGNPWVADATFMAKNTGTSLEFVENNLRYIKLKLPFREGFSWKGNSFIDTYSLNSDLKYLDGWDYTYEDVDQPKAIGTFNLDSTIVVDQHADSLGTPVTSATQYAEKNIGKEIYARKIGLVYRDFLHWEYQGVSHSYTGYGVTLTMIDHN